MSFLMALKSESRKYDPDGNCLYNGLTFGWNQLHSDSKNLDAIDVRQKLALYKKIVIWSTEVYLSMSGLRWSVPVFEGGQKELILKVMSARCLGANGEVQSRKMLCCIFVCYSSMHCSSFEVVIFLLYF